MPLMWALLSVPPRLLSQPQSSHQVFQPKVGIHAQCSWCEQAGTKAAAAMPVLDGLLVEKGLATDQNTCLDDQSGV